MNSGKSRGLALLFAVLVLALPAGKASPAPWHPRLGLEGGVNGGRLEPRSPLGNGDHWEWGGAAGLVARWSLAPGWSLDAGPGWERQHRRGTGTLSVGSGGALLPLASFDQSVRFDRAVFPVRVVLQPGTSGWSLEGGVAPSWIAHVDRESKIVTSPAALTSPAAASGRRRAEPTATIFESAGTFDNPDWTNRFHRWDAAVTAGAGWDQAVAGHVLRIRGRWQQGLVNLAKAGDALRLSSVSATLGLLW